MLDDHIDACEFDLDDPEFLERAREVREDIEAGVTMSFGDIADRLGMPFNLFVQHLAASMFEADPTIMAVVVGDPAPEVVH